jgi:hypothetical protein
MNILIKQFEICISTIVIVVLILIYLSSKTKKHSLFDRFVDKLTIVTGIFVAVGVLLTYKVFRENLEHTTIDNTLKIIDRGWVKINKEIMDHHKECPNLVNSLYFDWQKETTSLKYTYNTRFNKDNWYAMNYISVIIFQAVEDFLTTHVVDETGDYVWICNFLQWTKSPILKNMWFLAKPNYASSTIELLDFLFKISEMNNIKNAQELSTIAHETINSEEYKEILKGRNESRIY